ncbi:iron ABC transporter permease [Achromobacter sp. GG226]|uniref:FecCD family ABC transporter permease n=1 Tax=Verticiella alkaliphila TaxID=2779529 RepID=UPI001C0E61B0|nr:iron ABC transporter permease [Verticiella sp. GG226]MBU4610546.1 iron ABC transporter permease [Verticiella sp. GG226]
MSRRTRAPVLVIAALALSALTVLATTLGTYPLSAAQAWATLTAPAEDLHSFVLWELRLPRVALALLAGAALGVAGLLMQAITRNPLAAPGLIGVEGGASVTLLVVLVAAPGLLAPAAYPFAALIGGLAVSAVVAALAWRGDVSPLRLILVGIGMSALLGAVANLLVTYGDLDRVESALQWLGGSLHRADWGQVRRQAIWLLVVGLPLLAATRALDVFRLGRVTATSLGISVPATAGALLVASAVLTAVSVAHVGAMTFVGLLAPHLARQIGGDRHAVLLPLSGLCGAALVLAGDTLGRTLAAPLQVPAGLMIALVGAPYLILLLARRRLPT